MSFKPIQFFFLTLFISFLLCSCGGAKDSSSLLDDDGLTDFVNPLMGTGSSFELSSGNTYPSISRPWGMNSWTPQTGRSGDGWTYTYNSNKIVAFKQTHQPSPWINDYGVFTIMPVTGMPEKSEAKRASWFSHKAEVATPYQYSVYLADYDIEVSLSPTERAMVMEATYRSKTNDAWLVIDAQYGDADIKVLDEHTVVGYSTRNSGGVPENFRCYFVVELEQPILKYEVFDSEDEHRGEKRTQKVASLNVDVSKQNPLIIRAASSFISPEQALLNLKEVKGKCLSEVADEGKEIWENKLGRIRVEGNNLDHLRTFYSCLYRSLLFPRKLYEIDKDGNIVHFSPHTGEILPGYLYSDTGLWDTFRSLFPLLNLVYPEENSKILEGFMNHYRESGFFPEWGSPGHRDCMVGNNSASIMAEAVLMDTFKGDKEELLEALIKGAHSKHPTVNSSGRYGWEYYDSLGYVPYDVGINENAARTLEYAYNDWCIGKVADMIGASDEIVERYYQRGQNYRNLYSDEVKLMRGRNLDGTFQSPFSPYKWGDAFTEGNALHYTWSVFHDIQGLIDLMGGRREFVNMLDTVFNTPPIFDDSYYGFVIHEIREMQIMNMGNYAHGNQPIQHMIYLYNWADEPHKAQYRLREVMEKLYAPTPDGYCGDEDNGQTSAWYVFSAMGFYPVCPGTGEYILGTPLFDKVIVLQPNGKEFVIEREGSSVTPYVANVELNNRPHKNSFITFEEIRHGGEFKFIMSDKAPQEGSSTYGGKDENLPYSYSNDLNRE